MLTPWAIGLLAKIPKPDSPVSWGSEGSAGGSCSQPTLIRQCHVNVEGLWGLRDDPGPRKEQEPRFTPEPPGFCLLDAKVIRKAGQREACPFVCSHSSGLLEAFSQARPVTCSNSTPASVNAKAHRVSQRPLWKGAVPGRPRGRRGSLEKDQRERPSWRGRGGNTVVDTYSICTSPSPQQQRNKHLGISFCFLI